MGVLASLAVFAALSPANAAPPPKPLPLVDFAKTDSYRIFNNEDGTTHALENAARSLGVSTRKEGGYPGVTLEPTSGKWNLSNYEGVALDVRNPGDEPLRVLLSVNNPGADGRNHCNTESVNIPARGDATLRLAFGMWHGEMNHPLDLSNIVSVTVFLDQPKGPRRFRVDGIRAITFRSNALDDWKDDPFFRAMKPEFGRGVNLGNALEAPREGEWGVTLTERYFDLIRSAGFDSVRVPVRWSAHADAEAPFRIEPAFFERVDWVLKQCRDRKLEAVLNMHHYDELTSDPDAHRARFLALWRQIAARYRGQPSTVAFELLNEPHGALTADKWNDLVAEAIPVVRRTNPTRKIVVGPVGWNSIAELPTLRLPESDRNLVATFHYYNPFMFTHQGAGWAGPETEKWLGTQWTGTPAEKAAVIRDLDAALQWAARHKRPIYMGEFGAYSRADMDSRARWTRFVAEMARARKMGWAYWEFCAGFGVYDAEKNAWNEPIKNALLPTKG